MFLLRRFATKENIVGGVSEDQAWDQKSIMTQMDPTEV